MQLFGANKYLVELDRLLLNMKQSKSVEKTAITITHSIDPLTLFTDESCFFENLLENRNRFQSDLRQVFELNNEHIIKNKKLQNN